MVVRDTSDDADGLDTKYTIPDGHWDDDVEEESHPTQRIDRHEVHVVCDNKADPDGNYDRTKWTAVVTHGDDGPTALYFTSHRWKGNYWRDQMDVDFRDAPDVVKRRVAEIVVCDGVEDLDPGVRLIEEQGRSRWREIHMPRIEVAERDNNDSCGGVDD